MRDVSTATGGDDDWYRCKELMDLSDLRRAIRDGRLKTLAEVADWLQLLEDRIQEDREIDLIRRQARKKESTK